MKTGYYTDEAAKWFRMLASVLEMIGTKHECHGKHNILVFRPTEIQGRWNTFRTYSVLPVQSKKEHFDENPTRIGIEVNLTSSGRRKTIWARRNADENGWDHVALISRVVGHIFEDMTVDLIISPVGSALWKNTKMESGKR